MTAIKERPILFSGPMIRALLDGRKTVTRRAMKVQPVLNGKLWQVYGAGWSEGVISVPAVPGHSLSTKCPYGRPGDRLWVRETFAYADKSGTHDAAPDDHWRPVRPGMEPEIYRCWYRASDGHTADGFWKPSIHMPRWASRILLEITDVRVERLKDISEEQAQAEGCFFTDYGKQCFHGGTGWKDVGDCPAVAGHQQREGWMWDKTTSHEQCLGSARHAFGNLWNKVNGPDAWDSNPWVWAVSFRQVTP